MVMVFFLVIAGTHKKWWEHDWDNSSAGKKYQWG
jgi:hypothetical protein